MPVITDTRSPFQKHVDRWQDCRKCPLHLDRKKVVIARGRVPCDVLFVGEAPGASEDVIGKPFIGPAGRLLDQIIARSIPDGITYALTNLVCCIPQEDGKKAGQPPAEAIRACSTRLIEFVDICSPKLIVCVGNLARDNLDPKTKHPITFSRKIPTVDIVHPAYILRANVAQQGLAIQRCIVIISTAVEDYILDQKSRSK